MVDQSGSELSGSSRQRAQLDAGVCVFTVDGLRFALDTALVGEVIAVTALLPVPRAPEPILGLFSLRGTPVAVVDLMGLLGRPISAVGAETQALVLRTSEGVLAALRISRLLSVLPVTIGKRVETSTTEHPVVRGIFENGDDASSLLLDSDLLIEHLLKLGFSNNQDRNEVPAT